MEKDEQQKNKFIAVLFFHIEIKMKSVFKPLEFHSNLKRSLNKWAYMAKIDQEEEEEEKYVPTEMISKRRRECRNKQWSEKKRTTFKCDIFLVTLFND